LCRSYRCRVACGGRGRLSLDACLAIGGRRGRGCRRTRGRATAPNLYRDSGGASLRGGRRLCRGLTIPGRSRYSFAPGSAAMQSVWLVPPRRGVPFFQARGRGRSSAGGRTGVCAEHTPLVLHNVGGVRTGRGRRPRQASGCRGSGLRRTKRILAIPVGACGVVRADPLGSRSAPAHRPPP